MIDKKILFHVYSPGRKLEGEFGSKMAAKKFRDRHNATLDKMQKHDRAWWVGVGRDHWRWNDVAPLPKRGKEAHFIGLNRVFMAPEDHWLPVREAEKLAA